MADAQRYTLFFYHLSWFFYCKNIHTKNTYHPMTTLPKLFFRQDGRNFYSKNPKKGAAAGATLHLKGWFIIKNEQETPPTFGHLGPIQVSSRIYWKIDKTAFLEMSANIHSRFCQNLADFSACVPPPGPPKRLFYQFSNMYEMKPEWVIFLWINLSNEVCGVHPPCHGT